MLTPELTIVGISYRSAKAEIREKFAFTDSKAEEAITELYEKYSIPAIILSTCNRTELIAIHSNSDFLVEFLCGYASVDNSVLKNNGYIKNGNRAIKHLFYVCVGLDSQILGDMEISHQLKEAYKRSKKTINFPGAFERLMNRVLYTSKECKSKFNLTKGITSVSYALVYWIKKTVHDYKEKDILIYGMGSIGSATARNIRQYLNPNRLSLINRSDDKAEILAEQLECKHFPASDLKDQLANHDIIIVATSSDSYTVTNDMVPDTTGKIFIDLSIPRNVQPLKQGDSGRIVGLDEVSEIIKITAGLRKKDRYEVEGYVETEIGSFLTWQRGRLFIPLIQQYKKRLEEVSCDQIRKMKNKRPDLNEDDLAHLSEQLIKKATRNLFKDFVGDKRIIYP